MLGNYKKKKASDLPIQSKNQDTHMNAGIQLDKITSFGLYIFEFPLNIKLKNIKESKKKIKTT